MRSLVIVFSVLFSLSSVAQDSGYDFGQIPEEWSQEQREVEPDPLYYLVCFDKKGTEKALDSVDNQVQFKTNRLDYKALRGGCDYSRFENGERKTLIGFHVSGSENHQEHDRSAEKTRNRGDNKHGESHNRREDRGEDGFIFSVYQVTRLNGSRILAVKNIYPKEYWRLGRNRACGWGWVGPCVVPKSCEVLAVFRELYPWGAEIVAPQNCIGYRNR